MMIDSNIDKYDTCIHRHKEDECPNFKKMKLIISYIKGIMKRIQDMPGYEEANATLCHNCKEYETKTNTK